MTIEKANSKWLRALIIHSLRGRLQGEESPQAQEMLEFVVMNVLDEEQLQHFSESYFPAHEIESEEE